MTDFTLPPGARIDDEGVWYQVLTPPGDDDPRPGLLLDRDGVVVEEAHYLHKPEEARLIPGAAAVVAAANARGIAVAFVTNQAGIGYGYYDWPDFAAVQRRILDDLAAAGARVDAVFACPFHAKGRPPYDHPDHPARKPNPGMLLRAAAALRLDLSRSWIVGDRAADLEAGRRAGLAGGLHVLTGHGSRPGEPEAAKAVAGPSYKVLTEASIKGALGALPLFSEG